MLRNRFIVLLIVLSCFVSSIGRARAHGTPIDILANSATNRLFVIEGFEPGSLELEQGIEISTTSPGLGVNFAANGVAPGTAFELEITQELLYWDGVGLSTPSTGLLVFNPAFTFLYTVTESSGEQTGMDWATYPGGSSWDSHGLYRLDSLSATAGIYGLAVRVAATGYESTKPFLISLIYDPTGQWDVTEINAGIELLQSAVQVPFSANFDGDSNIDGLDFLAWQRNFGLLSTATLPSQGDADLDSDVDRSDLAFWEQSFGDQLSPEMAFATTVPEPATLISALLAWIGLSSLCRLSRDFYL